MFDSLSIPQAFFVMVNLLVLFFIMRKLLFQRVSEFMAKRTERIRSQLEQAAADQKEAAVLRQQYEAQLQEAHEEARRILDESRTRAHNEYEADVQETKQYIENMKEKAREDIARERDQMLKEVKGQVAALALLAASHVIEKNMDSDSNRALVQKFIDEDGVA